MKYFLSLAAVLLMAGCNDSSGTVDHQAAPAAATAVASLEHSSTTAKEHTAASRPATVTPRLVKQSESSPAALFQKCAACHGGHAEKSALNQSAVISEWSAERIVSAIVGYQDGTYGGAMKTLMQNQVKDLSRAQIEALADYIVGLDVKTH